ncbi:MAG TPA: polysaccharide biosynthesis/export family protein [Terracidiphilus sp.]|nr:polysaccharide biosynthesis/export family protein [Terracidiphilus sp.]
MLSVAKTRIQIGLFLLVCSPCLLAQGHPSNQSAGSESQGQPAQAEPAANTGRQAGTGTYVIGRDDVLSINVWQEKDLTRSVPVRSDGKISLPLVGELEAAGLTPEQLQHQLTEKLKTYITDPVVTVIVDQVNSKKFNILGQVAKPGSYSLTLASTVVDGIAAAGGFRDFAKKKDVYVLRQMPDGAQKRIPFNYKDFIKGKHPESNIKLQPRDTIIVP